MRTLFNEPCIKDQVVLVPRNKLGCTNELRSVLREIDHSELLNPNSIDEGLIRTELMSLLCLTLNL